MASEYQKWIKVASDLGYAGDELRAFVKDKQEEAKVERSKIEEAEKEAKKLDERKFEAEQEARKQEMA